MNSALLFLDKCCSGGASERYRFVVETCTGCGLIKNPQFS